MRVRFNQTNDSCNPTLVTESSPGGSKFKGADVGRSSCWGISSFHIIDVAEQTHVAGENAHDCSSDCSKFAFSVHSVNEHEGSSILLARPSLFREQLLQQVS